jgi:hypothetical protein
MNYGAGSKVRKTCFAAWTQCSATFWRITLFVMLTAALFATSSQAYAQSTPPFVAASAYNAQPGTVPIAVATGVFDAADGGVLDFAVLEQNVNAASYQVEIFHGNANGTFCTNCSNANPNPDVIPLGSSVTGNGIVTGQFRSAGFLDLAVATNTGIVFLQNNGAGTFTLGPAEISSGGFVSLVVGLFNGDSNYDIAAVTPSVSGSVSFTVFFGDGNGNFPTQSGPWAVSNTYNKCSAIMQDDFQSQTTESDLALLCSNSSQASVLVYLNSLDGTGNFAPGATPYTGSAFAGILPSVAVGILNNQGAIFVSPSSSSFESYESNGLIGSSRNGFTSVSMIPVGLAPRGSISVIYDPPSGAIDFVSGPSISTYTSYTQSGNSLNGNWASTGNLGPLGQAQANGFSNLTTPSYVVIDAGVDYQDYPNFEPYVDERSIGVFLVTFNGSGTVETTNAAPVYTGTGLNGYSFPPSFATGDFNGDGNLDLAVSGADDATGDATLTIYLGTAGSLPATTAPPASVVTVSNTDYSGLDAAVGGKFRAPQNGKTLSDLALFSSGQILVLPSNGDGTFGSPNSYSLSGDPNYPGFFYNPSAGQSFAPVLVATDVNGDGLDDIVLSLPEDNCAGSGKTSQGAVYVLISNGDGTFQSPVFVAPPVVNPVSMVAAKFYGRGVADLAFAEGGELCSGNTAPTTGTAVGILQNSVPTGATSITASEFESASIWTQSSDLSRPDVTAIASADLNGDGQPDLVMSNTNGIEVLLNQGSGSFAATAQGVLPLYAGDVVPGPLCDAAGNYVGCVTYDSQVVTGSFFAPGENDVAALVSGVVYIFQNQSAGTLLSPTQGFVAGPNSTVLSSALTGSNGLSTILAATSQGTAYLANGAGTPTPSYADYSNIGPINFGSVDVDSSSTQTLSVNNTGGTPFTITSISVSGTGYSLASAVCNNVPFSSSATLNAGASCTFTLQFAPTTPGQPAGNITIVDSAAGSNAGPAAGPNNGQTITLAATAVSIPTTTTLSVSPTTVVVGNPVVMTATVVNTSSGAAVPEGTVTFYSNSTTALGTSPISAGVASITISNLATGSYTITAQYQDATGTYAGSTSFGVVLTVIPAQLAPPQIVKTFGVASIPLNGITSLTFSISNPNSSASLSGVAFTDNFPSGLVVASPSNLTSNCGGTVTGMAGGSSVSLSGATLPSAGSCLVSLNVTGTSTGTITNSVTITSSQTPPGNTSTSNLVVQAGLFSPAGGTRGEILNVTFTGSGFVNGVTTIEFGAGGDGITVNSVTVIDSGDAVANITISPTAHLGNDDLNVITGSVHTDIGKFNVGRALLTVTPNIGTQGETMNVTLTGLTFVSGMTVQFGSATSGITVNSVTVTNPSEAIVNITIALNAPPRIEDVEVSNGSFSFTELKAFQVQAAALVVSPNTGTQGETMDVTLTGLTFVSGMTVQFGSATSGITVNSVTVLNPSEAIVNISIALNASTRPATVAVSNGQSVFEERNAFTVQSAALVVSPNTGMQGQTMDVTLTGLTFVSGMTAQFGSGTSGITVNSVTVLDASEAVANITIALNATPKPETVTVGNGQGFFEMRDAFTVQPAALVVTPNTGTQGETLNVTLTGLTFASGMTVKFSGGGVTVNSVTVPDPSQAIVNITISPNTPAIPRNVSVSNGQSTFSEYHAFTVQPADLVLTPNTGEQGQTLNVIMTGWTFGSGTTVEFGNKTSGITVNSVTVENVSEAIVNITIAPNAPMPPSGVTVTVDNGQTRWRFPGAFGVIVP